MAGQMRLHARVPAPAKEVLAALTGAVAMRRWLAEHAEADLPGRYAFWGRHTPQGDAPRQRPLHADERTLRLSWPLDGQETVVEFRLHETGAECTVVSVTQTWSEGLSVVADDHPAELVLLSFWSLAVANLADFLTGREPTPKCDYTAVRLGARIRIGASRKAVFASLTDPARFTRWFGLDVDLDPRPGGRWQIHGGGPVGRVLAVEPGRLLKLEEDSCVSTWTLADEPDGTLLTLALSGFDQHRPPYSSWSAWLAAVATLRRYHEMPGWTGPIWVDDPTGDATG